MTPIYPLPIILIALGLALLIYAITQFIGARDRQFKRERLARLRHKLREGIDGPVTTTNILIIDGMTRADASALVAQWQQEAR